MKKKNMLWTIIKYVLLLIFSFTTGIFLGWISYKFNFEMKFTTIGLIWIGISLIIAIYFQIILHEFGHMIFALMSGYKFISFRIGSVNIARGESGRLSIKKLSIMGTGGQCLMEPPKLRGGKFPFRRYFLGGSLMNVIAAILFIFLSIVFRERYYLNVLFFIIGFIGIFFAVTNAFPMIMQGTPNDGYNVFKLSSSHESIRYLWIQLKISSEFYRGVRLKDMPEKWFIIPKENEMDNEISAANAVFVENRFMDMQDFESAMALQKILLDGKNNLVSLYKCMLMCNNIYCDILENGRSAECKYFEDENFAVFLKRMRKFPDVIRTMYAKTLVIDGDIEGSEKILKKFEKVSKTFPVKVSIESERELIEIIRNKYLDEIESLDYDRGENGDNYDSK